MGVERGVPAGAAYAELLLVSYLRAYAMCFPFVWYCCASPKSIKNIWSAFSTPTRKFSGLMSLWIKLWEWTNSIRYRHWSAIFKTVFREKLLLQSSNKLSRDWPCKNSNLATAWRARGGPHCWSRGGCAGCGPHTSHPGSLAGRTWPLGTARGSSRPRVPVLPPRECLMELGRPGRCHQRSLSLASASSWHPLNSA